MLNDLLNNDSYWWLFYLITPLLLLAVTRASMEFGIRVRKKLELPEKSQTMISAKSMLALTAFMLAISFSIVEENYSNRKHAILNESNAISTAFLRSRFLREPNRSEAKRLLERYAQIRLEVVETKEFAKAIGESSNIQKRLWQIAQDQGADDNHSLQFSLFTQSLNDLIDLQESRIAVIFYHKLPVSILMVLLGGTFLTMGLLGFAYGSAGTHNIWIPTGPAILFIAVLMLIIDLDQTTHRFFQESQEPIADTYKLIKSWSPYKK